MNFACQNTTKQLMESFLDRETTLARDWSLGIEAEI